MIALPAVAADIDVVCGSDACSVAPESTPLFAVDGWVPGETAAGTISVANNRNDTCRLMARIDELSENPDGFANRIFSAFQRDSDVIAGGMSHGMATEDATIMSLLDDGADLGEVGAVSSAEYDWVVTFDPDAGNEYQGAFASFDAQLAFECVEGAVLGAETKPEVLGAAIFAPAGVFWDNLLWIMVVAGALLAVGSAYRMDRAGQGK